MAKSKEKNKALALRQEGKSIKEIANKIKVSKGTVSLWCRDIKLGPEQIKRLQEKMIIGTKRGCLKGARVYNMNGDLKELKNLKNKGKRN